jgi:arginine repressor
MELNHQIRFCRPFPFLFGFRAVSNNVTTVSRFIRALQLARVHIESPCEYEPRSSSLFSKETDKFSRIAALLKDSIVAIETYDTSPR